MPGFRLSQISNDQNRVANPDLLPDVIENYQPSTLDSLAVEFQAGREGPGTGVALEESGVIEPRSQFYAAPKSGIVPPKPPSISEDEWKASEWFRPDVQYFPGMTKEGAAVLAKRRDKNTYAAFIDERESSFQKTLGIPAMLAGSLTDPVNVGLSVIPVPGLESANLTARLGVNGARAVKGFAQGAVGNLYAEPLAYATASVRQEEYGMVDSLVNLTMGGFVGSTLHLAGGKFADWQETRKPDVSLDAHMETVNAAVNQLEEGIDINVEPIVRRAEEIKADRVAVPDERLIALETERQAIRYNVENLAPEIREQAARAIDALFEERNTPPDSGRFQAVADQAAAARQTLSAAGIDPEQLVAGVPEARSRDVLAAQLTDKQTELENLRQSLTDLIDSRKTARESMDAESKPGKHRRLQKFDDETNRLLQPLNNRIADLSDQVERAGSDINRVYRDQAKARYQPKLTPLQKRRVKAINDQIATIRGQQAKTEMQTHLANPDRYKGGGEEADLARDVMSQPDKPLQAEPAELDAEIADLQETIKGMKDLGYIDETEMTSVTDALKAIDTEAKLMTQGLLNASFCMRKGGGA